MEKKIIPWGKVLSYNKQKGSIIINGEHEDLKLEFITNKIVRFHFSKDRIWRHNYSFAIEIELPKIDFEILEKDKDLILNGKEFFILINKDSGNIKIFNSTKELIISDYKNLGYGRFKNKVYSFKKIEKEEAFLGLGEKIGGLNKKGKKFVNWNTDDPHHYPNTDPLYQTHPFLLAWSKNLSYGIFFDNTYRTFFNLGEENDKYFYFYADNGEMDYYFIYGPTPKEVIEEYTFLTGRYYMPPLWSLGYQQSKWGYGSLEKVKELAENFRKRDIPCDVIYLDIDHLEDFKVFTVDKEKFPKIKELIKDLNKNGFKLIPIVDPGVKKDINFEIYKDGIEKDCFCRKSTGEIYVGYVWPGECVFPDFVREKVRKWWGEKQKKIIDLGFSGIWNDMNEPSSFSHPLNSISKTLEKNNTFWGLFSDYQDEAYYEKTFPRDVIHGENGEYNHDEIHNVYGLLMVKASFEGWKKEEPNIRPLILTRAGYSGIQKYSAVWTGDNKSWWEHLYMSIPMLQNLSISGVPFVGADVGGFGLDSSPEIFARWIELGIFYPFLRNHSELNTRPQEPWAFGEEIENIARRYLKLRYRLIPYLYSLFWEAKEKGIPPLRALVLEFPDDSEVLFNDDEFMLGSNLLIAPTYREGARARIIYLPKGKWYDFWNMRIYEGNNYIAYNTPLDTIPIFIREGSIIPMWEPQNYIGEKKQEVLEILVVPSTGDFIYYEDDGVSWNYQKGEYNLINFSIRDNIFNIEYLHKGFPSERKIFKINYLGRIIEIEDNRENLKIKLEDR